MNARPSVHAGCVVVGEAGVLLRGPSGSGKSSLGLRLIADASARGRFARLVADDRVLLEPRNGRLIARAPGVIAGLAERRGWGVQQVPFAAAAVVRLVVDLGATDGRLPDLEALSAEVEGIELARLAVSGDAAVFGSDLVLSALNTLHERRECGSSALAFGRQDGEIANATANPSHPRPSAAAAARLGHRTERNEFCAETR